MNPNDLEVIDKLAVMVAGSSSFQSEVAKYTSDLALTRVHQLFAQRPDLLPRPFALIEIGELNATRIAGGFQNRFALEASLTFRLASHMANPDDPVGSLKAFWLWSVAVILEVLELSGLDSHLNITGMEQEQPPVLSHELSGDEVPYVWASWRVPFGTF